MSCSKWLENLTLILVFVSSVCNYYAWIHRDTAFRLTIASLSYASIINVRHAYSPQYNCGYAQWNEILDKKFVPRFFRRQTWQKPKFEDRFAYQSGPVIWNTIYLSTACSPVIKNKYQPFIRTSHLQAIFDAIPMTFPWGVNSVEPLHVVLLSVFLIIVLAKRKRFDNKRQAFWK